MTARIFQGCHEIEAAKQRLATANTWKKSSTEMVMSARRQLESAEKEVKEAESFLKETSKRWEVIDVYDYSESESDEESDDHVERRTIVSDESSDEVESKTDDALCSSGLLSSVVAVPSNEDTAKSAGAFLVEQIVVEGGGVPEVNGTYKRCQIINDGFPLCFDKSLPAWSKSGLWEGEMVDIFIFGDNVSKRWSIAACQTESELVSVYSSHRLDAELPPQNNDWFVSGSKGLSPVPHLKWYVRVT